MVFAIRQCESTMDVHVPPILSPPATSLPTPSLQIVPEHQPCVPALCIELALIIYFTYSNVHVPGLFSQVVPPSPSPAESQSLFLRSVSPLLPCT